MAYSNNLSPIPFYDSLEHQDSKKWWAYGDIYPLVVPCQGLVPFVFLANTTTDNIEVYIYKMCCKPKIQGGDFNNDFSNDFLIVETNRIAAFADHFHTYASNGEMYVWYDGESNILFDKGQYYIDIILHMPNAEEKHMYSEVFTCVSESELSNYTKIEWGGIADIVSENDVLPYSQGFKSIMYLDTDICMPIYEYEEEGENRNGYFFPIKQISYKKYTFKLHAPEYLCDAMRLIPMSDYVTITDNKKGTEYSATQFVFDASWLDGGHYAEVDCEFTTQTVVKVIGKSINI